MDSAIKEFVRNRSCPDGSIVKVFLIYECISFRQNYLSIEDKDVGLPTRKHLSRLAGYGHREGYYSLHVSNACRCVDFDRAY
jgi:hypothetical protein